MPLTSRPGSVRSGGRTFFRHALHETFATLREAWLMPLDLGEVLPMAAQEDDVAVLVHGFFATAGVFRPLRARLEADGVKCASFSHAPGQSVDTIARRLARLVERLPGRSRVHVVGHSLGGLASRWYVQELGGHARVAQTISLGSPFGGTERARPFPILVGKDLHRRSDVLARLRLRAFDHEVPHTSIYGDADRLVVPTTSAAFPRGDVVRLGGRGHNALLYDPEAIEHVLARVRAVRQSSRAA